MQSVRLSLSWLGESYLELKDLISGWKIAIHAIHLPLESMSLVLLTSVTEVKWQ